MLPRLDRLDRLSLKPTGEFYALTRAEAAEEEEEPIYGHPLLHGQARGSLAATFRVRSKDPRQGTTDQYIYHYFEAQWLWEWVKKEGQAFNPNTREPLWKEDWLALHDRFAPDAPLPSWVRNLPHRERNFVDNRTYAAARVEADWWRDLVYALNAASTFAQDNHLDSTVEQDVEWLEVALNRIIMWSQARPIDYGEFLRTEEAAWPATLTDVIDALLASLSRAETPPRAKAIALEFVRFFTNEGSPGYVRPLEEYVHSYLTQRGRNLATLGQPENTPPSEATWWHGRVWR